MSIRISTATARMDKSVLTPQGFLRIDATLTRTGVFVYRRADGKITRELRHPDDVFHPDSLESLRMAPVTDDHPEEMVSPENVKALGVGWIDSNIIRDGAELKSAAIVADASALKKVRTGKRELSCGYHADVVEEAGVYNGEAYDSRQTNIRYNHVAIVDRGRAGRSVRLRLDSEDAVLDENPKREDSSVEQDIVIGGKTYKVSKEVFDSIMAERAKKDAETASERKLREDAEAKLAARKDADKDMEAKEKDKEIEQLKKDNSTLQAKVDTLTEKVETLGKEVKTDATDAAVAERMAVQRVAGIVIGKDFKMDGKANLAVMKEVIQKRAPKTDAKKLDDEAYVRARFDSISEDLEGYEERRQALPRGRQDSRTDADFDSEKARKDASEKDKKRWEEPLSSTKK